MLDMVYKIVKPENQISARGDNLLPSHLKRGSQGRLARRKRKFLKGGAAGSCP